MGEEEEEGPFSTEGPVETEFFWRGGRWQSLLVKKKKLWIYLKGFYFWRSKPVQAYWTPHCDG